MQSAKIKFMKTQATRMTLLIRYNENTISLELRDPRRFLSRRKYIAVDDLQKRYPANEQFIGENGLFDRAASSLVCLVRFHLCM